MATNYWLHVNHPNNKAILHVEDGCTWVRRAVARIDAGQPYGPECGEKNGYWSGPFPELVTARKEQQATSKARQDRCSFCWG